MPQLERTQCCGIRELNGVQQSGSVALIVLKDAARGFYEEGMGSAFIFFSIAQFSAQSKKRGKELTDLIEKYKLGVVQKTHAMLNPNSGRMLTMYMWEVNKSGFQSFYKKYAQDEDEDEEDN